MDAMGACHEEILEIPGDKLVSRVHFRLAEQIDNIGRRKGNVWQCCGLLSKMRFDNMHETS